MRILAKPLSRKTLVIGLVLVSVLVTSAYALTALFTHTFPATPPGTTQVVTTTCAASGLTMATTFTLFTGQGLDIVFTCPNLTPALTATSGKVTPTFTLPSIAGTTLVLALSPHTTTTLCGAPVTTITSGTLVTFSPMVPDLPPGDYDYCLLVNNYPSAGIPSFTATWSQ